MKRKVLLLAFAAVSASVVTGCCCCSQPACVEEEAIIITPVQKPMNKKCDKSPKTTCNECGCQDKGEKKSDAPNTVAVNIAGCSSEDGKCPVPAPAPAPQAE